MSSVKIIIFYENINKSIAKGNYAFDYSLESVRLYYRYSVVRFQIRSKTSDTD